MAREVNYGNKSEKRQSSVKIILYSCLLEFPIALLKTHMINVTHSWISKQVLGDFLKLSVELLKLWRTDMKCFNVESLGKSAEFPWEFLFRNKRFENGTRPLSIVFSVV